MTNGFNRAGTPITCGTICAYAETKENAKKVLNIIHRELKNVDCDTCIDACRDGTLTASYIDNIDGNWLTASHITGTGKWIFENDGQQLLEWLQKSNMDELKSFDFRLELEFNESEWECADYYKATMKVDHKAGDLKIKLGISKNEYNEYTFHPGQPNIEKIDQKEHTDEKQEKMENAQISNKNDEKTLKSNQHNSKNNTLGTIYVPEKLEAGTYTLTKTKTPAEEKTVKDLLTTMVGRTAAAVVVATIFMYGYLIFRLMYEFVMSLF